MLSFKSANVCQKVLWYSQLVQHVQALQEDLLPQEDPEVNTLKGHGDLWMFLKSITNYIQ